MSTAKYSILTFFPKNLLEQFRRIANIYFLLISILQVATPLSPTSRYNTLLPLCGVLLVTMIKEIYEDVFRHRADGRVNNSKTFVVRQHKLEQVEWRHVRVGEVVYLKHKDGVPADIVCLSSSEGQAVHIETSNLDGETNLKIKETLPITRSLNSAELISSFSGEIECEEPDQDLYRFSGTLRSHSGGSSEPISIDLRHVIWRGTTIMHTEWMFGLVVYTGQETKLIRNSRGAPSKRSRVDRTVNTCILLIFAALAVLCTASTIMHSTWVGNKGDAWYLSAIRESTGDKAATFVTFIILFNNLVPISLYVSLELVKVVQAAMIGNDIELYDPVSDQRAMARTSNLNEDLGQIQYVICDKTGTLTCNRMEFYQCSVGGQVFGGRHSRNSVDASGLALLLSAATTSSSSSSGSTISTNASNSKGTGSPSALRFQDPRFVAELKAQTPLGAKCREFLLCLSLCHTVMSQVNVATGERMYNASSPDEGALVQAASQMGYEFLERTADSMRIRVQGTVEEYKVLQVNEFTSARKRMSVVLRFPDGRLVLYCKGADEAILNRLSEQSLGSDDELALQSNLVEFASRGLRTLVMAKTELTEAAYEAWSTRYRDAVNCLQDREKRLEEVAAEVEQSLELIGSSAIEDQLQEGVPETITQLREAGIKVWVATGDKLETAQNIAFSCRLLAHTFDIVRIVDSDRNALLQHLTKTIRKHEKDIGGTSETLAILVDGRTLSIILSDLNLRFLFLTLAKMAKTVVACRVVPAQKADLVRLIRSSTPEPMTLAIGDGANDVAMIQEAHVGVGIIGNEGMQAVRASDYAIAQYRFLARLLLVHGRWSYLRISQLILYSFYKNMTFVLILFFFNFSNGFTGTTLFESWLSTAWNVIFTFLPILALGIFDQDVPASAAMEYPQAYLQGQQRTLFNHRRMIAWVMRALLHSLVVYNLCTTIVGPAAAGAGQDLFTMGTIMNFCAVLTVNLALAVETRHWTVWNFVAVGLSLFGWFAFVLAYAQMKTLSPDFYGIANMLFKLPLFWLSALLVPLCSILTDVAYHWLRGQEEPAFSDVLRERCILLATSNAVVPFDPMSMPSTASLPAGIARALSAPIQGRPAAGKGVEMQQQQQPLSARASSKVAPATTPTAALGSPRTLAPAAGPAAPVPAMELDQPEEKPEDEFASLEASLTLNPQRAILLERLRYLQDLVNDNVSRSRSNAAQLDYLSTVRMHPLTLSFRDNPDLEAEFQRKYILKSLRFMRLTFSVVLFFLVVYVIIGAVLREAMWIERAVATGIAALALGLVFTRLFRRFYYDFLVAILLIGGVWRTLLVNDSGIVGLGVYSISVFLLFRTRFWNALVISLVDLSIYIIWMVSNDRLTGNDLLQVVFLQCCLISFCAYVCYQLEYAFRRDFLRQNQQAQERERTQEILDNMLPRHITKQIESLKAKREAEAKQRARDVAEKASRAHAAESLLNRGGRSSTRQRNSATSGGGVASTGPPSGRRFSVSTAALDAATIEQYVEIGRKIDIVSQAETTVSILFCDITNFSTYIVSKTPSAVVTLLDAIYSLFDELCAIHGVQKMETVGKSYMASAGLPGTRADHAVALAEMAEDMIDLISKVKDREGRSITIRVGIHTGKVKSGVVGTKRPQFSLFGDTVNTSSRMQSTSEAKRIHVSSATWEHIKSIWRGEPRTTNVKGKGSMRTYLLGEKLTRSSVGRKFQLVEDPNDVMSYDDVKRLIAQADPDSFNAEGVANDSVSDEEDASQQINMLTLRFTNEAVEKEYLADIRRNFGQTSRRPAFISAFFCLVQAWFEFNLSLSGGEFAAIFCFRYVFVLAAGLVIYVSSKPHYGRWAATYNTALYVFAMVGQLAVPLLLKDRTLDSRTVLAYLFFVTLLSNGGTLRLVPNLLINCLTVAMWAVASHVLAPRKTKSESAALVYTWFVIAGCLINLFCSYGRENYQRKDFVMNTRISKQKQVADILLYSMLPKYVAQQLKASVQRISEKYDEATILYSDIKGFTNFASASTPESVVKLLSLLFSAFDALSDVHNVYKVQTIGDAYVLVGGFPFVGEMIVAEGGRMPTPADNADKVVRMGFDMLAVIKRVREVEQCPVEMRIGIHTGQIIAGVIGTKQLRYDIWGTDCLVANTMESNGVPSGVTVSFRTAKYLMTRYRLVRKGHVHVKGEGLVEYFTVHSPIDYPERRLNTRIEGDAHAGNESWAPPGQPEHKEH